MAGTYVVEVDWNNDADYGDTGEDITSRVLSVEWTRGRDVASQLTGRSSGGHCTIILNNESGDYSPFNTLSPLTGNLLPARKIRIRSTAPTAATLWTGFINKIEPMPSLNVNLARIDAIGPLAHINRWKSSVLMKTNRNTGDAIGDVLDDIGWSASDRTIDTGDTTMARWWVDRIEPLNALRQIEDSESGFIYEGKDGKIIFEKRQHRFASPHTVSQATFSDAAAAARAYSAIREEDPLPFIFNDLRATIKLYSVGALAVLWTHPESGASSPLVDVGEAREFWAQYPNPDSATTAVAVDAWTTPVASTDLTANSAADGTGIDLSASIGIAVSKFGGAMKITLTNNSANKAYLTLLQARGTPVAVSDPVTISRSDSASQTKYGQRTYPAPGPWIPTTSEAKDYCGYHLSRFKDPSALLEVTVYGARNDTHLTEILTRDISERVTVVASNDAGLGLNRDFFIEAEHHYIDKNRHHSVKWLLSDATQDAGFWVLGISTLGVTTKLAY